MTSLAQALPAEINRVRALQDEYRQLLGMPGVIVEPTIAFMDASITRGVNALAGDDVVEMLRAFEDLKGWGE
jgi:hypothetical protein